MRPESDITIDEMKLYPFIEGGSSIDILSLAIDTQIFEDIYSPFLSGSVVVSDTLNIIERMPITGHEILKIKFRTSGMPDSETNTIDLEFAVYKIANLVTQKSRNRNYRLDLISREMIQDARTKVSKSYKDTATNIVSDIMSTYVKTNKDLFVEDSAYVQRVVFPNWSPLNCCKFLTRRSISKKYNDASYLFYETTRGYHFKTIEELSDVADPARTFKTSDAIGKTDSNEDEFDTLIDYSIIECYDTITNYDRGLFSSKLFSHDPINKRFKETEYNYIDSYDDFVHLDKGSKQTICPQNTDEFGKRISDYPDASQQVYPSHNKLFDDGDGLGQKPELWALQRASRLAQFSNWAVSAEIYGDSRMNVGQIVAIEFPDFDTSRERGRPRYYNGRYMVTAVRHKFAAGQYRTRIEMVKDCVNEPFKASEIDA